jgi:hypothetical protein
MPSELQAAAARALDTEVSSGPATAATIERRFQLLKRTNAVLDAWHADEIDAGAAIAAIEDVVAEFGRGSSPAAV